MKTPERMATTMPSVSPTAGGGGAGGDDGGGIATFRIRLELMAAAADAPAPGRGVAGWPRVSLVIWEKQRNGEQQPKYCTEKGVRVVNQSSQGDRAGRVAAPPPGTA